MTWRDYWRDIVEEAVTARGGIMTVPYSVMNKHIAELQATYDDVSIRNGFRRFAGMVATGKVDVRRKTAWFVFYSQRERFIRKVFYGALPDDVPPPSSAFGDGQRQSASPLGLDE